MVVDASAAMRTLGGDPVGHDLRITLQAGQCHAPHLFDAEIGHVLRGHERAGQLEADEGRRLLGELADLIDHRYPHVGELAESAWALRHTVSFYDALYVALAAELDMPLVTADARLARASGLTCTVELV